MASTIVSKSKTINNLKELRISLKDVPPFQRAFLKSKIADELSYGAVSLINKLHAVKALILLHEFQKAAKQAESFGFDAQRMTTVTVMAMSERLQFSDYHSAKSIAVNQASSISKKIPIYDEKYFLGMLKMLVGKAADDLRSRNLHWNAHNLEYEAGLRQDKPPKNYSDPRVY